MDQIDLKRILDFFQGPQEKNERKVTKIKKGIEVILFTALKFGGTFPGSISE
jgi:hypothetical protein